MYMLNIDSRQYRIDARRGFDLSIPLQFGGPQPNHFGAPAAAAEPLQSGAFVGDTRLGGSCNCEVYRIVPHCNGTHTECLGHVTEERVSVGGLARDGWPLCALLSIDVVAARHSDETSDPPPQPDDRLVTRGAILSALGRLPGLPWRALALRTLPNTPQKLTQRYADGPMPAFLSRAAAETLVELGIEHLLVDLPSIDRLYDDGRLSAHRIFWGLPPGSRETAAARRPQATVTEMIYAADEIGDGAYVLDLQLPPFVADAAPSRPLLYRLEPV